jgi:hypothetical protein
LGFFYNNSNRIWAPESGINKDSVRMSCELLCKTNSSKDFCETERVLRLEKGVKIIGTCYDFIQIPELKIEKCYDCNEIRIN